VIFLILSQHDPFLGMNAGFVGLLVNMMVTTSVSFLTKPPIQKV
jgi:SSS family solute:Na+ symporter